MSFQLKLHQGVLADKFDRHSWKQFWIPCLLVVSVSVCVCVGEGGW